MRFSKADSHIRLYDLFRFRIQRFWCFSRKWEGFSRKKVYKMIPSLFY